MLAHVWRAVCIAHLLEDRRCLRIIGHGIERRNIRMPLHVRLPGQDEYLQRPGRRLAGAPQHQADNPRDQHALRTSSSVSHRFPFLPHVSSWCCTTDGSTTRNCGYVQRGNHGFGDDARGNPDLPWCHCQAPFRVLSRVSWSSPPGQMSSGPRPTTRSQPPRPPGPCPHPGVTFPGGQSTHHARQPNDIELSCSPRWR